MSKKTAQIKKILLHPHENRTLDSKMLEMPPEMSCIEVDGKLSFSLASRLNTLGL
jgi:hypothetical protein